nr:AAA family ATPase [Paenibacillus sp. ACRRX]
MLSDVVDAGINVVLTAHSNISKFDQPDEMGSYNRYQLKLGAKTESKTAALTKKWADMVLFINYKTFGVTSQIDSKGKATKYKAQGGIRTVYATHHPAWNAKNRHGLPDEFPLAYSYIAHIFNGPSNTAPPLVPPRNYQQDETWTVLQPSGGQVNAPPAPAQVHDTSSQAA